MTPEPEEGFTVEFTDALCQRCRYRFEPLSDGWERVEERHQGCRWVPVGREPIDDVVLDAGEVSLP